MIKDQFYRIYYIPAGGGEKVNIGEFPTLRGAKQEAFEWRTDPYDGAVGDVKIVKVNVHYKGTK